MRRQIRLISILSNLEINPQIPLENSGPPRFVDHSPYHCPYSDYIEAAWLFVTLAARPSTIAIARAGLQRLAPRPGRSTRFG